MPVIVCTLGDLVGIALATLCILGGGIYFLVGVIRQHRCKHTRFHETSACEAICADCGKNLGFIGNCRP